MSSEVITLDDVDVVVEVVDVTVAVDVGETPEVTVEITGHAGPPGKWVQMTRAEYNALIPPDPGTLYIIIG